MSEQRFPVVVASERRESPQYVRLSMASAIALRFRSGRFREEFKFGGINVLLDYEEGCRSDCGYCGLARTRPGNHLDKSFIRVEWPQVETDELIDRMVMVEAGLTRLCISMVTHGRACRDTVEIVRRVAPRVRVPISVLVAPPTITRSHLENFKAIGVDMIGVGLDAVTEELFRRVRADVPSGGLKWERYWQVIADARDIFGPWKVNVHTLVGLGETDLDLVTTFVNLRDREVFSYLFCFNPEPDSRMGDQPKSDLVRWRRVQLARHLVEVEGRGLDDFDFDATGALVRIRVPRDDLDDVVARGTAFTTNGCPGEDGQPGCTRPYGSYRPSEPFRDYPFNPTANDLEEIRRQLDLDGVVE